MPVSQGRGRRLNPLHVLGAAVVSAALVGVLAVNFVQTREKNVATAQAWKIDGPPCPTLSKADFDAKGYRAPQSFTYDDIVIARKAGNASCQDLKRGGGTGVFHDQACQFTGPAALVITSKKGAFAYTPEPGQPVTVVVHEGVPRCVLGGNYKLTDE